MNIKNSVIILGISIILTSCAGQPQFKNPVDPINWPNQKPTGLQVTLINVDFANNTSTMLLKWDPMTSAVKYYVHIGLQPDNYLVTREVEESKAVVFDTRGYTEYFAVSAINSRQQETQKSEPIRFTF